MKTKHILALIIFIITLLALFPNIRVLDQHGDEKLYLWKAFYYSDRLIKRDFSQGTDPYLDPGFEPRSFWAWEQPFGSHWVYVLAMGISNTNPPELPYSYTDRALQGPETNIPFNTLFAARLAAIICAAAGLAFLTLRFGWVGFISSVALLTFPFVRINLSRAWAEGPLLLGFGLCAISYKTRWFPIALGVAAAFKLTALALYPLLAITGSCGNEFRFRRILTTLVPPFIMSLLTPVSWFFGGPFYLLLIFSQRFTTWLHQSKTIPTFGGVFFPDRYLWPFMLMALLLIAHYIQQKQQIFDLHFFPIPPSDTASD